MSATTFMDMISSRLEILGKCLEELKDLPWPQKKGFVAEINTWRIVQEEALKHLADILTEEETK